MLLAFLVLAIPALVAAAAAFVVGAMLGEMFGGRPERRDHSWDKASSQRRSAA